MGRWEKDRHVKFYWYWGRRKEWEKRGRQEEGAKSRHMIGIGRVVEKGSRERIEGVNE